MSELIENMARHGKGLTSPVAMNGTYPVHVTESLQEEETIMNSQDHGELSTEGAPRNETELELQWISNKKVVVQIPGTNEHRLVPDWNNTDSDGTVSPNMSASIKIPQDHVVFVSFLFHHLSFYCSSGTFLSLTTYSRTVFRSRPKERWRFCRAFGKDAMPPESLPMVLEAGWLVVRMVNVFKLGKKQAFVLGFSFHQKSRPLLQRLPSGQWNCSLPEWSDFDLHFVCNLLEECAGGEDEADCPYTGHCGHGHFDLKGRCYKFVSAREKLSWFDAQAECVQSGGHLASLNSPQEWEGVANALRTLRTVGQVLVGLRQCPPDFPSYYAETYVWEDRTIALYVRTDWKIIRGALSCGALQSSESYDYVSLATACVHRIYTMYLCEMMDSKEPVKVIIKLPPRKVERQSQNMSLPFPHVTCASGHVTHQFLACDPTMGCWTSHGQLTSDTVDEVSGRPLPSSCPLNMTSQGMTSLPPLFRCGKGQAYVAYSVVCDSVSDCMDRSDERFCLFPDCPSHALFFPCGGKCIPEHKMCDTQRDCHQGEDEVFCGSKTEFRSVYGHLKIADSLVPPLIINYDHSIQQLGFWAQSIPAENVSSECPQKTHFVCAGGSYCLPVYVICNEVNDCPLHDDELDCSSYTCPGYYRCRGVSVCLHPSHLCDAVYHCPQKDDELCDWVCPPRCTCQGHAYVCRHPFQADQYRQVRYLDAADSNLTAYHLFNNTLLIFLSLCHCRVDRMDSLNFTNLHVLDVSDNLVNSVSVAQLKWMKNLRVLILSGNPLASANLFSDSGVLLRMKRLVYLSLAETFLAEIDTAVFRSFPSLKHLNFSHSEVRIVSGQGFSIIPSLRCLDFRGCPVTQFPRSIFRGLHELQSVFADNYKLCCSLTLPQGFNLKDCQAPFDEVSSCEALLRSNAYRIILAVYASLSLWGNLISFVSRMFWFKSSGKSGFAVFVTHLSVSDFLMGIYLSVVGVADYLYTGTYLWEDDTWRHSVSCQVAGFLSLLSNEMSAVVVCVITLDRFLALRFPFSGLKFYPRSAQVVSCSLWFVCGWMAGVPLLGITAHWQFYSQTGVCIPLPVTRADFAGHSYTFGLIIVFNFVLFLLIATGQTSIYLSIRANTMTMMSSERKSQDMKIARHLISVAVSDFVCWFPIGLLGLLASRGVAVPGEINVAMAVVVLPLNSALNPFLYNLSILLGKRRQHKEERLLKIMSAEVLKE